MSAVRFNTNEKARVVLTEEGREVYEAFWRDLLVTLPAASRAAAERDVQLTDDNVVETELHELMHIFGSQMVPGGYAMFVNNEIELGHLATTASE